MKRNTSVMASGAKVITYGRSMAQLHGMDDVSLGLVFPIVKPMPMSDIVILLNTNTMPVAVRLTTRIPWLLRN